MADWVIMQRVRMRALATFRDLPQADKQVIRDLAKEMWSKPDGKDIISVVLALGL